MALAIKIKSEKTKTVLYLLTALFFFVVVYTYADLLIRGLNLKDTMYKIIGRSLFASERPNGWERIRIRVPDWLYVGERVRASPHSFSVVSFSSIVTCVCK